MKALSLWQPWASAMALGCKRIETRHWATQYRGPVLIHAAKRLNRQELAALQIHHSWEAALRPIYPHGNFEDVLPFGAIVAIGRLVDCVPTQTLATPEIYAQRTHPGQPLYPYWSECTMGNWQPGRFGWVFEDIKPLPEPIPYKGMQGLFDVPSHVLEGRLP